LLRLSELCMPTHASRRRAERASQCVCEHLRSEGESPLL
jgi:hypothetical protein